MNSTGAVCIVNFGSIILPGDSIRHDRRQKIVCGNDEGRGRVDSARQVADSRTRSEVSADSRPVSSSEVVDELMARVVAPCLNTVPGLGPGSQAVLKGVLLVGPPGVGKTFAVRALQETCKDICTVSPRSLQANVLYVVLCYVVLRCVVVCSGVELYLLVVCRITLSCTVFNSVLFTSAPPCASDTREGTQHPRHPRR